jgi:uncharacterized membrane protein
LSNLKISDYKLLKDIAENRLRPNVLSTFFLGAFFYSGIMALVGWNAVRVLNYGKEFWEPIIPFVIALVGIQLVIAIFFMSESRSYKYQKLQSYLIVVTYFKVSIDAYLVYFLACFDRNTGEFMIKFGVYLLISGLVYLMISTIRGFYRLKKGAFRKNGKGLYNFQNSKGYVSLPIIFVFVLLGGLLARANFDYGLNAAGEVLLPLLGAFLVQNLISMMLPEFILVAYCKTKFKSFKITP